MASDEKYWLGFSLVPEIGPRRLAHLLSRFGDLPSAWHASDTQLYASGLEREPTVNLLRVRREIDLDRELEKVHQADSWLLTRADEDYPALLKTLPDAPVVLYLRGTWTSSDERALAIVGTRRATSYGRDAAYDLARQLAGSGITIVSGLAHGIDSAAHRGALEAEGRTIAVLGCGIDVVYPRDNRELAEQMVQHGALVSEFPIGAQPEARNFPRRNRVISGLSLGVLVVEAPEESGALITAEVAAEQGREVFAVPGNIFNPMSKGTNLLIQDGAKLVMSAADVLDELNIAHTVIQTRTTAERIAPANETEARLLEHLTADPLHIDEIARLVGLPIATVTSTLTILELKGLARSAGHMQYVLSR